jgi:hypothetical protein
MSSFALHSLFSQGEPHAGDRPGRAAAGTAEVLRADAVYGRFSPTFYAWLIGLIEGRVPPPAND